MLAYTLPRLPTQTGLLPFEKIDGVNDKFGTSASNQFACHVTGVVTKKMVRDQEDAIALKMPVSALPLSVA